MNKSWEYKKISDVCIVERGGSPRPIDKFITDNEDGINWIKIGDTSDSMYITETAQKIIPEGMKKSRYVKPGDFLLSNSMSFGRPYILKIDGCIHDGWLVLRDEQDLFDKRFLYYYLSSKTTYEKFKSMAVGGVVNNLNSEMVRNVEVPVPSKEEQKDIADLLDKLKTVVDSRKQELQLLDNLIKARFVEMFNAGDYKQVPISELIAGKIPSAKKDFSPEDKIKYIDISSIDNKRNIMTGYTEYILGEAPSRAQQHIKKGDIVISTVRPNLRNVAMTVFDDDDLVASSGFCVLRAVKCLPEYLLAIACSDKFTDDMTRVVTGANYPAIKDSDVMNYQVSMPPMGLQKRFASFVNQVDKSKVAVQKALDKTQLLFDSLMQEYFG